MVYQHTKCRHIHNTIYEHTKPLHTGYIYCIFLTSWRSIFLTFVLLQKRKRKKILTYLKVRVDLLVALTFKTILFLSCGRNAGLFPHFLLEKMPEFMKLGFYPSLFASSASNTNTQVSKAESLHHSSWALRIRNMCRIKGSWKEGDVIGFLCLDALAPTSQGKQGCSACCYNSRYLHIAA